MQSDCVLNGLEWLVLAGSLVARFPQPFLPGQPSSSVCPTRRSLPYTSILLPSPDPPYFPPCPSVQFRTCQHPCDNNPSSDRHHSKCIRLVTPCSTLLSPCPLPSSNIHHHHAARLRTNTPGFRQSPSPDIPQTKRAILSML